MVTLPVGAILFLPLIVRAEVRLSVDPSGRGPGQRGPARAAYLNENFFVLRTYVYFLLWSIWIFAIYHQSTKQDSATHRSGRCTSIARWSAPGLFLVVAVGTLAAYDWLMSVQPTWYSTIFGLYYLAGGALAFMSVVTLVCLGFRRAGILTNSINIEHYHDLGKWLFATDGVLHLHRLLAIPADLVRQYSGGDHRFTAPGPQGRGCGSAWLCRSCASSFRSSCCCAGRPSAT